MWAYIASAEDLGIVTKEANRGLWGHMLAFLHGPGTLVCDGLVQGLEGSIPFRKHTEGLGVSPGNLEEPTKQ